ncbi:hypothetical protein [Nannocystis pusilla]|uniref:hypothetical protein n=1 Tax=Nannocystis pusilla TaxID=889268 RepID=UPI003B7B8BF1
MPRAAVPERMGRGALIGFGDGVREPAGPRDATAVLDFVISGRWSPLYFADSPSVVGVHLGLLFAAALALTLGFRTRLSAIASWLLYAGLLRRGEAHWGGEQVFCAFLFLLMWSRCGAAYSVDNWRRCRALRRRGLLSMPSGPGAGAGAAPSAAAPHGLAAIYRRIPAWPQALMAGQLALCYAANGWVKAGTSWQTGDVLQFVLLRDTYVRWDMSAAIATMGPWPLRLASWGVMWWERLFPLVLVGLAARALGRSGTPALRGPRRRRPDCTGAGWRRRRRSPRLSLRTWSKSQARRGRRSGRRRWRCWLPCARRWRSRDRGPGRRRGGWPRDRWRRSGGSGSGCYSTSATTRCWRWGRSRRRRSASTWSVGQVRGRWRRCSERCAGWRGAACLSLSTCAKRQLARTRRCRTCTATRRRCRGGRSRGQAGWCWPAGRSR